MWTKYIKSKVFTRIKVEGTKRLQKQFPNIYFTTSGKAIANPKFPTVYVKSLSGSERGRDLEGTGINAIVAGFQVDVIDNKSENNAETVAYVVQDIMKRMEFEVVGSPFSDNSGDEYRVVARYQRNIGYNDVF